MIHTLDDDVRVLTVSEADEATAAVANNKPTSTVLSSQLPQPGWVMLQLQHRTGSLTGNYQFIHQIRQLCRKSCRIDDS